MTGGYRTTAEVLAADEAILDAAWMAHRKRHQCSADGVCEAPQTLSDTLARIRELREREAVEDTASS